MPEPGKEVPPEVRPVPRDAAEASAEQLSRGLWRLRLPVPYSPRGTVNCYLLEGAEGPCLIDCGTSLAPGWDALEHALVAAGVEPAEIGLLVCTHGHPDHYGLAATVKEVAGCPLAMAPGPPAVADILRDPLLPFAERRELVLRAGVPAELTGTAILSPGDDCHHEQPSPDLVLEDGDTLPGAFGAWRVIPIPGHAPTQIALHDEERRLLVSADLTAMQTMPYLEYGWSADPWAEQIESLRRCREADPAVLLPGHGPPVTDPAAALDEVRACFENAPGLITDALAGGERRELSAYEIVVATCGDDSPFYVRHMALAGALAMLERLVAAGACAARDGEDGIRQYALDSQPTER
jgi:glyoxylase-like metal-dependent hydrolase (beta-lactamase superfamily II)